VDNNISEIKITDKLPSSHHLPLSVVFSQDHDIANDTANRDNPSKSYSHNQTCNWHKVTSEDISRYEYTTKTFLCNIRIPLEALRQCQAMEETACADALATSLSHKHMMAFWKSIGNLSDKSIPLATFINGITGAGKMSEMWSQHYSGILNCVNNVTKKCHVQSLLNSIDSTDQFIITPNNIAMAIRDLERGKNRLNLIY